MVDYRSYSQISSYEDCPYRYYLERVAKVWQRPAAWFPHGTAVHKAAEEWELSGRTMTLEDAQDVFRESYASEVNRYAATTPNFEYWFSSGPYRGTADVERRYQIGLEMVEKYVRYYTETALNERPWTTPDGKLAIELPFDMDLDGVRVRGFIDGVYVITHKDGTEEIRVRDNKTGVNPGTDFQLAVYAVAVNDTYGTNITTGDFWMGKTGKPSPVRKPHDLSGWTKEKVAAEFKTTDEAIRAGKFDAKPEPSKCGRCSVATSCPFVAI